MVYILYTNFVLKIFILYTHWTENGVHFAYRLCIGKGVPFMNTLFRNGVHFVDFGKKMV